jgi:hypothetical protein
MTRVPQTVRPDVPKPAPQPRRRLAVASALVTVGNIGGLRHEDTRDGVTANILAFCVAASATGKEAVQQAMAHLHHAACCIAFLQTYEARHIGTDDRGK